MIRTRFAPSPTGYLHIGSLRTALYAYALAKHSPGGQFILRIEDTDQKREVQGATQALQDTLHKFGLSWDEFYLQSQRTSQGIYQQSAHQLLASGHAFYCTCPPKNAHADGYSLELRDPCRTKNLTSGAIKLKVPDDQRVSYYDFVHRKEIAWDTNTVYDATLLKSDGNPTYHLAAMTDDLAMQVTHVLRGHDWLPSTPIHLLVFDFLSSHRPQIGHLTDILSAQTGKKLSKRRDSVFVENFLKDGYLPEALLNFIMLLGWAPKDNRELFSLADFVQAFDESGFQDANPRFLPTKLDWFNGQYLRQIPDHELVKLVKPYVKSSLSDTQLTQILPLVKERMVKLSDFDTLTSFFVTPPVFTLDLWPNPADSQVHLTFASSQIAKLTDPDFAATVKEHFFKVGDFFMSLRIAICGSRFTPPISSVIAILGPAETTARITAAQHFLSTL
jgi:glutamyl-tRNA synthetase